MGYNENRSVKNVTFENVKINGKKNMSGNKGDIIIGEYVKDAKFIK